MERRERKNKYIKKSDNRRSKFLTRADNRAIKIPVIQSPEIRERRALKAAASPLIQQKIKGDSKSLQIVKTDTVNTVYPLVTIGANEGLKDIIVSHWSSGSTDSVISLYWSFTPIEDFTFTVSAGRISSSNPGTIARLFTMTIPHASTISLYSEGMLNSFFGFDKNLYFYAVSSVQYTHWTVIKDNA